MLWSVITVTYNSARQLAESWSEFLAPQDKVEWIVVDNASHDGSADVARSLGATTVLELPENVGFGAANNIGVNASRGDVLFFANPDLHLTASTLERLYPRVSGGGTIVAPQLVDQRGRLQPNGRGTPSLVNKIGNRLIPGRFGRYYRYSTTCDPLGVVFVIGAALSCTRSDFDLVGGWDDRFFVYYEDSDFCLRAAVAGIHTVVDGNVRCVHEWARETSGVSLMAWKNELRSARTFYGRYPRLILGI